MTKRYILSTHKGQIIKIYAHPNRKIGKRCERIIHKTKEKILINILKYIFQLHLQLKKWKLKNFPTKLAGFNTRYW